jgi:hypothetical protein
MGSTVRFTKENTLSSAGGVCVLQGDVWSAHLPYVDAYLALDPTVKVIALERERDKVATSFDELSKPLKKNNFQSYKPGADWRVDPFWDPFFPKYNGELPCEPTSSSLNIVWSCGLF